MKPYSVILLLSVVAAWAQPPSLRGIVTDPSGAAVPGAVVQLRGPGREQRARTGDTGQYSFLTLAPGKYQVRMTAKGFTAVLKKGFVIDGPTTFDLQLTIESKAQVINVEDQLRRVTAEPEANGSAVIMRGRQLEALSDDPDELALQLQALAGPAPGPNGGQIFIDGFTGGNLPPKSAIREVRINSNPFSPEYDRPGFARVEIFTKPGSDTLHGQAALQFNDSVLNSRNPLLTQATRPPFRTQFYTFDATGPVRRNKTSFTLDAERRQIDENAFVLATALDPSLNPIAINQAVPATQTRAMVNPRLDYTLSPRNTLVARYQDLRIGLDNQGVGDFNLPSRAYREQQAEHTVQLTETAMISARLIDETRFQYLRSLVRDTANNSAPAINVQGAFTSGGATVGNSTTTTNSWELTHFSTYTRNRHTMKWGGRVRQSFLDDESRNNFAGTYTFYSLAQYRDTLAGMPGALPSQFSLNAGTPGAHVSQADLGLFANDDWRVRPNLTVSYGVRFEAQDNRGGRNDWAPRLGIAWGIDAKGSRAAKTVVRAGFGAFYDRVPLNVTLNQFRYNGVTQQSYLILNPAFFPTIPPAGDLLTGSQPQQLRPVAAGIQSPQLFQGSVGIERQVLASTRLTLTWITSRGLHLLDVRNINAPIGGAWPFGDRSIRLLTESAGSSRQNQVMAGVNVNAKTVVLFGSYTLSYGKDDNESLPADPYNLRAEWGPSAYGDLRHRLVMGATVPIRWKFSLSPFLLANSGQPYNITTGLDPGDTGFPAQRPSLVSGVDAPACHGNSLIYAPAVGCLNGNPAAGTATIGHNFARGPANVNLALRVSRTWSFGSEGRGGMPDSGSSSASHVPIPHSTGGRRYSLTLSASTLNALNRSNFAPPNGDMLSAYFGQPRSLGGLAVMSHGGSLSTYNRKIDLQLRLTF